LAERKWNAKVTTAHIALIGGYTVSSLFRFNIPATSGKDGNFDAKA